jgi:hypothetical protein
MYEREISTPVFYSESDALETYIRSLKEIKDFQKEKARRREYYGQMSPWDEETYQQNVVNFRASLRYLVSDEDL